MLLSPRDLDRAEAWYGRHERWGVLGSRLLPVIRNFVAVPAGVARVPALRFGVLTAIGSLIWDAAMALIGYGVGGQWKSVMKGFSDAGYLLGALAVVAVAVVIWHRWRSYTTDTRAGALAGSEADPKGPSRPRRRLALNAASAIKVPARITAVFWAIKLLSTAMGESFSDALVHGINQYLAVVIGFVLFVVAMGLQLSARRYNPWTYWFAVAMVAVFGTMAADVLHIGLARPVRRSPASCTWSPSSPFSRCGTGPKARCPSTASTRRGGRSSTGWPCWPLSPWAPRSVTSPRPRLPLATSDRASCSRSCLPCPAWRMRLGRANAVAAFWLAYILTRPLGASVRRLARLLPPCRGHRCRACADGRDIRRRRSWSSSATRPPAVSTPRARMSLGHPPVSSGPSMLSRRSSSARFWRSPQGATVPTRR